MNEGIFCQIHIKGHIPQSWHDWFTSLNIDNLPSGESILYGWLPDQGAFFGIMNHIRDTGMILLYIEMISNQTLLVNRDETSEHSLQNTRRL